MFELNKTYNTIEFCQELGISPNTWKRKATREKYIEYLEDYINYTVSFKGRTNLYTVTAIYQPYGVQVAKIVEYKKVIAHDFCPPYAIKKGVYKLNEVYN